MFYHINTNNNMANFVSDFSLFPIKHLGQPGWEYRKATWPKEVDPEVHKIFDETDPLINANNIVHYTRITNHKARSQYCKVSKINNDVIMEPGDGYNFLVRKDSTNNKDEEEKEAVIDDSVVPHDIICVICMTHKRTHAVPECGHVSMCSICAKTQFETNGECPICRVKMDDYPIKLFFA